jgi:flavin-dependent dehydrogenase
VKIAIAGAGMAGSYLYRILKEEGFGAIDIYDQKKSNGCGHRPCAWGFAPSSEYYRLVSRFTDPQGLVLKDSRAIRIDDITLGADLLTVDKPALNKAILDGAPIHYGPFDPEAYDRVIDATGVERAYLGPVEGGDFVADLAQYRVRSSEDLGLWINTSSIGYEWCFPLREGEFHVGFGNLKAKADSYAPSFSNGTDAAILCKCHSRLRMSSPYHSKPFVVHDRIVGVGESIGTVAPLGGDGNLYAMQCAELLVENWDDLDNYSRSVQEKFDWMRREREGLERLMEGQMPTMRDLRIFVQHARRAGFEMGTVNALRFFKKALQG